LATAIAGGVVGSAILALYTVPAAYQLMTRQVSMASDPAQQKGQSSADLHG